MDEQCRLSALKEFTRSKDYRALELTERIGESTICRKGLLRKCMDRWIVTKNQ